MEDERIVDQLTAVKESKVIFQNIFNHGNTTHHHLQGHQKSLLVQDVQKLLPCRS